MSELTAKRTLVKSPPELWSELSEVEGLARHLGEFGEIRITKSEPEKTVAWEGEHASGTVEMEASGWGTKVTLTAAVNEPAAQAPEPEPVSVPVPEPEPPEVARVPEQRGFLSRLLGRRSRTPRPMPARSPGPAITEPGETVATPVPAVGPDRAQAVLEGALDSLGSAHHRPFSRG